MIDNNFNHAVDQALDEDSAGGTPAIPIPPPRHGLSASVSRVGDLGFGLRCLARRCREVSP